MNTGELNGEGRTKLCYVKRKQAKQYSAAITNGLHCK